MAGSKAATLQRIGCAVATHGVAKATIPCPVPTPPSTRPDDYSIVAMIALSVSIPSPFSELVTTISG